MTADITKNGNEAVIRLEGRLDTTTAPTLDKMIAEQVESNTALTLDFAALEYVSSAGLRVLLGAQKKLQKQGSLRLVGVREEVMEVFEMTGFSDILTIE